jgi:hypothetical protein
MNTIDFLIYDKFIPTHDKDITGWNGLSIVFEDFIKEVKPKIIIEVGTWKGQSAINMGHLCKKYNLNTVIYCVDTWLGALEFWTNKNDVEHNLLCKHGYPTIYYQFLSNVVHENLQDTIIPIPTPSNIGSKILIRKNIKADLIYIDGSHEYEDVLQDIKNYSCLLNLNGIMFGDDYNKSWPGVKQAVDEYVNNNKNIIFKIYENNFWSIQFLCTTT